MKLERQQWQTETSCNSKKPKNSFGTESATQCLPETENAIRANGPPNTPQVHGTDGYMIVGSVFWNEDWLGPAANPHKVQQASQILRGPGVNCVSLTGAVYVWYFGTIIVHANYGGLSHYVISSGCALHSCIAVWVVSAHIYVYVFFSVHACR